MNSFYPPFSRFHRVPGRQMQDMVDALCDLGNTASKDQSEAPEYMGDYPWLENDNAVKDAA